MKTTEFVYSKTSLIDNSKKLYTFKQGDVHEIELLTAELPVSDTQEKEKTVYKARYKGGETIHPLYANEIFADDKCTTAPTTFDTYANAIYIKSGYQPNSEKGLTTYVYDKENGIKCKTLTVKSIVYDYKERAYKTETTEPDGEQKHYKTYEECLDDQEFDIYDKEGVVTEHFKGKNILFALSEKQREIKDRLEELIEDMEKNDLTLLYDRCYGTLSLLNNKPLHRFKYEGNNEEHEYVVTEYDGCMEASGKDENKIIDVNKYSHKIKSTSMSIYDTNEDYCYATIEKNK